MKKLSLPLLFLMLLACSGHKGSSATPPSNPAPPSPNPSPTSPTSPGDAGGVVEQQQYMVFHNLKRCWHNVPNVKWNANLAAQAKSHAAKCTMAKDPSIAGRVGENIAFGKDLGQIPAQDQWYMEFLSFPFGAKNGTEGSQEFSQIVWKATTDVGCASALCPQGNYYVCRYSPAGNVAGQYDVNVFPLKSDYDKCTGT